MMFSFPMNNLRMMLQVQRFCSQVLELLGNFESGFIRGSLCNSLVETMVGEHF